MINREMSIDSSDRVCLTTHLTIDESIIVAKKICELPVADESLHFVRDGSLSITDLAEVSEPRLSQEKPSPGCSQAITIGLSHRRATMMIPSVSSGSES